MNDPHLPIVVYDTRHRQHWHVTCTCMRWARHRSGWHSAINAHADHRETAYPQLRAVA